MKNKISKGFSLIEMIVAVTIVLILTGIGVANFSSLSRNKNLLSAKNELVSWLASSRNLAVTGQLPDESLDLKFVKVNITSVGITAVGINNSGPDQIFFNSVFSNRDNLSVSGVTSFGFNKWTGRLLDEGGGFINGPITITLNNGETAAIIINDLGAINGN